MIERDNNLSISCQCDLLGVPRSSYYYAPIPETPYNLMLMKEIDLVYLDAPSFGGRRMKACLERNGHKIGRPKVVRLMKAMDIEAIYCRPKVRTTIPGNIKFPYLLKDLEICAKDQVWGTDITYIPLNGGFLYLVAFMDLYSRRVMSWKLSNSLDSEFCLEALMEAFQQGLPGIVNSDQGVQYTSRAFVELVTKNEVKISMSGRGRCWDNIFVERLWRTLKYEEVYLKQYQDSIEAHNNIYDYIEFYNNKRPHSALNYKTPTEVYRKM